MDLKAKIPARIAKEINASTSQVAAAIELLDGGATVPFIARYRKEATGGLDDTQLRDLSERVVYLRELEARRETVLKSIQDQGKLTDALTLSIMQADTKAVLEDIYLPYKPKRRTRAMIARENGLEPLARAIQENRASEPSVLAEGYLNAEVADVKAALNGARDILTEELAERAEILGRLRELMAREAHLVSRMVEGKETAGAKFSDYFAHSEPYGGVPSHRALAMMRGANEGMLTTDLELPEDADQDAPLRVLRAALEIKGQAPGDKFLSDVAGWCWRVKLKLSITIDLMSDLRKRAEEEAINVFARNLKDLLLAAPAGHKATIGLDPGIRTGVKLAVVDATGKVLETTTLYPFQPKNDLRGAQAMLGAMIRKHGVNLIAIGNGTASRETEKMVADLLKDMPAPKPTKVIVSEAGASVYSASALAAREFPDLDVSLRGAVSIARRLQDPLAELVKIEPKSIGVGQYQHDVDQHRLARALDGVVEDAVNAVGVDLNTASAPLLARVSGLGPGLAEAIVAHRDANGAFASRKGLKAVPRLGERTFEQCAGFLRITGGTEPLDASSVHPEAYDVARKIVQACGRDLRELMKDPAPLRTLRPQQFVTETFGLPTVQDIFGELEKPGRDPRPDFKTATFADGIDSIKDLKEGMQLEGTVTNVAAFGAFVDIGVHQDGLVHVSQLSDKFVKDPHEVVKAGDVVRVRVTEVDVPRNRIGLSMKSPDAESRPQRDARGGGRTERDFRGGNGPKGGGPRGNGPRGGGGGGKPRTEAPSSGGAMASALAAAFKKN
ncbi:Tex family protein [Donghicola mangrovi]|uniref:Small ribosomal subunit protein bS1 n=1 Tax=Donghicola mangrovi TaxID=2729614 RepID=A0A850Q3R0_9RHOB|nr:Tex family protein [Donghicola mangrovi]NVO22652.1 RNA-binding transcriptional accessory protein [Donghicola mangrovi]